jgi:hypothetical protein
MKKRERVEVISHTNVLHKELCARAGLERSGPPLPRHCGANLQSSKSDDCLMAICICAVDGKYVSVCVSDLEKAMLSEGNGQFIPFVIDRLFRVLLCF